MTVLPFPRGRIVRRFVGGADILGPLVKDDAKAKRNVIRSIGRRFAPRFKLCGEPTVCAPLRLLPKERLLPEDLLELVK